MVFLKHLLILGGTVALPMVLVFAGAVAVLGYDKTVSSLSLVSKRALNKEQPLKSAQIYEPRSVIEEFDRGYAQISTSQVQGVNFEKRRSPFIVPTDGIAAHPNYVYNLPAHGGVDIWTNTNGRGLEAGSSKGYAVYAACSGLITRVYHPNEEIEIICDEIAPEFADVVPSLKVKTLYAHMGDAVTHQSYHSLRVGKRVKQGELLGYQGNVSSIVPVNRVTHLHFGIYDLSKSNRPTLNPEPYIGVPTTVAGQVFKTEI